MKKKKKGNKVENIEYLCNDKLARIFLRTARCRKRSLRNVSASFSQLRMAEKS